jgi:hypothetical protein
MMQCIRNIFSITIAILNLFTYTVTPSFHLRDAVAQIENYRDLHSDGQEDKNAYCNSSSIRSYTQAKHARRHYHSLIKQPAQALLDQHVACASWREIECWQAMVMLFGQDVPVHLIDSVPQGYHACNRSSDGNAVTYIHERDLAIILQQWHLYNYPAFWQFIRNFPNYLQHIQQVAHALQHDVNLQQKLSARAQEAVLYEAARISQERMQRIEQTKNSLQKAYESQVDTLNAHVSDYQELTGLYKDYAVGDCARLERRIQALQATQDSSIYKHQSYTVPLGTQALLLNNNHNPDLYAGCYGNQLQQQTHRECLTLLEQTSMLQQQSLAYKYQDALVELTDVARAYNHEGLAAHALSVIDLCWSLLDYSAAMVQGAATGIASATLDIVEHPLETTLCALAGEYVLAYQLAKVAFKVADIGITAVYDTNSARDKWDDFLEPALTLIQELEHKELTLRDAIQRTMALACGLVTQHKLLKGLNRVCSTAVTHAKQFAQKNPISTPQEYMSTPEGVVLRSIPDKSKPFESGAIRITSKKAQLVAERLGFKRTNYYSHGQPVFQKGNVYITVDVDRHLGGFWKMADSVENLGSKRTRLGTYDEFLNRIGD